MGGVAQESSVGAGGSGRKVVPVPGSALTVAWRRTPTEYIWLVMAPRAVGGWLAGFPAASDAALLTASGQRIVGRAASAHRAVKAEASETGLPWTIAIAARNEAGQTREFASRRRLVAAGVGAILVMLAGTSVVLWRVVRRELAVARLQTDFVLDGIARVPHAARVPEARHRAARGARRHAASGAARSTTRSAGTRNGCSASWNRCWISRAWKAAERPTTSSPWTSASWPRSVVAEFRSDGAHEASPSNSTVDLPAGGAG